MLDSFVRVNACFGKDSPLGRRWNSAFEARKAERQAAAAGNRDAVALHDYDFYTELNWLTNSGRPRYMYHTNNEKEKKYINRFVILDMATSGTS